MGDNELISILQHSSQLRILEVRGESFTDKSLCWISKTCLDLETLVIEAPKMTDVVVEQIATACPRISSWSLIDCTSIENGSVEALELKYSAPSHYIQSIPCRYNDMLGPPLDNINWTATGGSRAGTASSNRSASTAIATSFSASSSTISSPSTSSMYSHSDMDPVLHSFNPLDHAPSFALDRYTSTLEQSASWGRLTTFEIRNCTGISPSLLSPFLRSQTALEYLILGGISITDDSLVGLTETPLTRLQSLALYGCREISDETMVAVIFNCDQMKKLTIFGSNFTLRTFSSISLHLKQLEELHMEHVPLVMNESVQSILLKCSKLRVLKLWHCRSLTQDLFTDQDVPCDNLEELEFMDKFPRSYSGDGSKSQVKLLESLVTRFEHLRILRLAKLAESLVSVNLVSYLCQLDRLEKFTILENPGLDYEDLQELHSRLPSLIQIGLGSSEYLADNQIMCFTQSYHRPGIQMYSRMLESSDELDKYVN
ncbi:hypothetical protein BGZ80_000617 [Entomortierella chlamydospora]|uniref:RNI-like protein n=1 Tax=Entomortierella chlamydospora TaxID=101097 RepID=A0A9P6N3C6_9FUNG|nr:hypothetical protein BGZ80_000617 [Entomortierella chlamydospora]